MTISANSPETPKAGAYRIVGERIRQVEVEKYDADVDDQHDSGELVAAALCYIRANEQLEVDIPNKIRAAREVRDGLPLGTEHKTLRTQLGDLIYDMETGPERFIVPGAWPWYLDSFKPSIDPIRNLEKAGALLAAEIDRLERANSKEA